ncbi:MAG: low molecular weight phosphotyrosine protein phosphatase [Salinarimonas sp.]|nr:low molecular weight phosphotyrosine protein phosphatase [Salinarimonas sp.]
MRTMPAILFVCLGNICRSPLAEAALREEARRRGVALEIDSAGTGDWHVGAAPDPRAQAIARAHDVEIGHYRVRQVTSADFTRFSHIIALDHENLANLQRLRPAAADAELSLLLDHVPGREGEPVADPYFGGPVGFAVTWADVTAGAQGLLARLTESDQPPRV